MRSIGFLALLAGCGSEHVVTQMCGTPREGFDIEEASVLEDAQGYPDMHDAVVLEFDDVGDLPEGARWRVKTVEILPMIGQGEFDAYEDGQEVTVEIWDADEPDGEPFSVTQTFEKDDLEWELTRLESPETVWELNQRMAWWSFDFTEEIGTEGLDGPEYLVGVAWSGDGAPNLGYSNFNRPCDLNWTDYGDGMGWILNGDTSGDECSWPMLRVELEVLQEQSTCTEGSAVVE